jgi:Na+-driven multidrug efflux pump
MMGAAWSSTISYAVQSLVVVIFFGRITGVPLRKLWVPERGDLDLYRRLYHRLRGRLPSA